MFKLTALLGFVIVLPWAVASCGASTPYTVRSTSSARVWCLDIDPQLSAEAVFEGANRWAPLGVRIRPIWARCRRGDTVVRFIAGNPGRSYDGMAYRREGRAVLRPNMRPLDLPDLAAHEFGHLIGAGHAPPGSGIMSPVPFGDSPTPADALALCRGAGIGCWAVR